MTFHQIYKEFVKRVKKEKWQRCKEYSFGCGNCQMWRLADDLKEFEKFSNPKNWKPLKLRKPKKLPRGM